MNGTDDPAIKYTLLFFSFLFSPSTSTSHPLSPSRHLNGINPNPKQSIFLSVAIVRLVISSVYIYSQFLSFQHRRFLQQGLLKIIACTESSNRTQMKKRRKSYPVRAEEQTQRYRHMVV